MGGYYVLRFPKFFFSFGALFFKTEKIKKIFLKYFKKKVLMVWNHAYSVTEIKKRMGKFCHSQGHRQHGATRNRFSEARLAGLVS